MFEISRIMRTSLLTVKKDTPVYKAMNMLVNHGISGLPVIDDNNQLLGILSEKDTLKLLTDQAVDGMQPVEDFMSVNVIAFTPQDSAVDVCDFFIRNPYRRVPIVEDGRLVGLVSRRDIIDLILKIRGKKDSSI